MRRGHAPGDNMDYLQAVVKVGVAVAAIAYFFPVFGIYLGLFMAPWTFLGVFGNVWGLITPLRVPDRLAPVKNRCLFVIMIGICLPLFAGAVVLLAWCIPRADSIWGIIGAGILAAITSFVAARYEARHPQERVSPWIRQRFPDMRGNWTIRESHAAAGFWERLGVAVLTSVLSSGITWMMGLGSGIDLFDVGYGIGGIVFVRASVSLFS